MLYQQCVNVVKHRTAVTLSLTERSLSPFRSFSAPHVLLFELDTCLCPSPTWSLRHFVDEGYSYIGAPWHPRVCHAHHPLAVTRPLRPKLRRSALRSSSASGRLAQSVISPDDQRPDGAFHDGAFACVGNSGLSLWRRQDVLTLQPAVDECRVAVSPARKRLNRIM